jgi:hypothetical protein
MSGSGGGMAQGFGSGTGGGMASMGGGMMRNPGYQGGPQNYQFKGGIQNGGPLMGGKGFQPQQDYGNMSETGRWVRPEQGGDGQGRMRMAGGMLPGGGMSRTIYPGSSQAGQMSRPYGQSEVPSGYIPPDPNGATPGGPNGFYGPDMHAPYRSTPGTNPSGERPPYQIPNWPGMGGTGGGQQQPQMANETGMQAGMGDQFARYQQAIGDQGQAYQNQQTLGQPQTGGQMNFPAPQAPQMSQPYSQGQQAPQPQPFSNAPGQNGLANYADLNDPLKREDAFNQNSKVWQQQAMQGGSWNQPLYTRLMQEYNDRVPNPAAGTGLAPLGLNNAVMGFRR